MRVTIRPWRPDDAASLLAAVQATPDLDTQMNRSAVHGLEAAEEYIHSALAWDPDAGTCSFAIDVDGRAAGNAGLSHMDYRHRTAWLSYWIASDSRGLGLAGRAAAGAAGWAIQELNLFRIELGHRANNPASCAVAKRAGFLPDPVPALDLPTTKL